MGLLEPPTNNRNRNQQPVWSHHHNSLNLAFCPPPSGKCPGPIRPAISLLPSLQRLHTSASCPPPPAACSRARSLVKRIMVHGPPLTHWRLILLDRLLRNRHPARRGVLLSGLFRTVHMEKCHSGTTAVENPRPKVSALGQLKVRTLQGPMGARMPVHMPWAEDRCGCSGDVASGGGGAGLEEEKRGREDSGHKGGQVHLKIQYKKAATWITATAATMFLRQAARIRVIRWRGGHEIASEALWFFNKAGCVGWCWDHKLLSSTGHEGEFVSTCRQHIVQL